MIERLPHWVIPNKYPAFLEGESATAIEMVAKLYGKTDELIADYNKFVDAINQHIEEFENSTEKNYELFTVGIRQEFQDFIDVIELKIQSQDAVIGDAVQYMKDNLKSSVQYLLSYMAKAEELSVNANYNEETYSLSLNLDFV